MIEHSREADNILAVLAKFGGLFSLIKIIFQIPGFFANNRLLFAKFIRTLYFKEEEDGKLNTINFSIPDAFSHLRKACCKLNKN